MLLSLAFLLNGSLLLLNLLLAFLFLFLSGLYPFLLLALLFVLNLQNTLFLTVLPDSVHRESFLVF